MGGSKYNNPVFIKKRNFKKRFFRIITHGLIDFVKETIFLKIWSWDHGPKPEFIHIFKKVGPDPVTNEVGHWIMVFVARLYGIFRKINTFQKDKV